MSVFEWPVFLLSTSSLRSTGSVNWGPAKPFEINKAWGHAAQAYGDWAR